MSSQVSLDPDQRAFVLFVGQDQAGHWLVQDDAKRIEGRFVSFAAAMSYARAEGDVYHAEIALAARPLIPSLSFTPLAAHERALPQAA